MVATKAETFDPKSHPITATACGVDEFEASDDCQSDEENLLEVSEPTDTEVASLSSVPGQRKQHGAGFHTLWWGVLGDVLKCPE